MTVLVLSALLMGAGLASLRWLRVAQREHYLPGAVSRFAFRWWTLGPVPVVLLMLAAAATGMTLVHPAAGLVLAAVVAAGPPGLALRGRSSPLAWTGRLRRVAVAVGAVVGASLVAGWLVAPVIGAVAVFALPLVTDLCLALLAPLERRLGAPWVDRAARALAASGATVVAVTGSYGKTSTKGHITHLLAGSFRVVASPASFNNRMGLARAINEHLAGGVEVFVAEMGTYGPGEIAELCSWIPPDIAVITAIGPVHLERFGSEERIVQAKSEILDRAAVAVLVVDDPRLRAKAEEHASRRRVITVGSEEADVVVGGGSVRVGGESLGEVPRNAHPTNVGCAVAVALALDVPPPDISARLASLAEPEHRLTVTPGTTGAVIIDDTFNSNPAGARAALGALEAADRMGRRVVVTPGMVELGARQDEENRRFAAAAARVADYFVVVGRTNRRALQEGAGGGRAEMVTVTTREEAVEWVRTHLGEGDVVLYENDLPDHYP